MTRHFFRSLFTDIFFINGVCHCRFKREKNDFTYNQDWVRWRPSGNTEIIYYFHSYFCLSTNNSFHTFKILNFSIFRTSYWQSSTCYFIYNNSEILWRDILHSPFIHNFVILWLKGCTNVTGEWRSHANKPVMSPPFYFFPSRFCRFQPILLFPLASSLLKKTVGIFNFTNKAVW